MPHEYSKGTTHFKKQEKMGKKNFLKNETLKVKYFSDIDLLQIF